MGTNIEVKQEINGMNVKQEDCWEREGGLKKGRREEWWPQPKWGLPAQGKGGSQRTGGSAGGGKKQEQVKDTRRVRDESSEGTHSGGGEWDRIKGVKWVSSEEKGVWVTSAEREKGEGLSEDGTGKQRWSGSTRQYVTVCQ